MASITLQFMLAFGLAWGAGVLFFRWERMGEAAVVGVFALIHFAGALFNSAEAVS